MVRKMKERKAETLEQTLVCQSMTCMGVESVVC